MQYILLPVQERLKQQKEEADSNPDYDKSFKGQLSKEEKKAKRKQILSNIGAPPLGHTLASGSKTSVGVCPQQNGKRHIEDFALEHRRENTQCPCGVIFRCMARGCCMLTWHAVLAGEDLLVASADKPFRFPATFTFVVRSFTVLDGIGKSLDPRFDISEIAAPYARDLILEAKPQFAKLQQEFNKRLEKQVRVLALHSPPDAS